MVDTAADFSGSIPEYYDSILGPAQLNALEAQVDVSNQTLKAAEARVREARALVQQARAALFPTVSANASATRTGSGAGGRT